MSKDSDRRMLLVHAHPDDETIGSGVTMAKYAADGAHVALVTCTLGEEGEVLVADLAHIGVNGEDRLGEHRINELGDAMKVLGVADWRRQRTPLQAPAMPHAPSVPAAWARPLSNLPWIHL